MSEKQILRSEFILEKYGKSLAGKTVLITGVASNSIAGELAIQLSTASPKLLILSARDESKVAGIIKKIQETNPNVATRFLKMDLGDLGEIRQAVKNDLADVPLIDHVACVAGVMTCPYGKTKDGFETQFGVNYLANFLLVKLLLPKVQAAGPSSSVIIVSSSVVRLGRINFDDLAFSDGKTYDSLSGYAQSNIARVMFAKRLGEKLKSQKIRVFSIDPGAVISGLQRHVNESTFASLYKDDPPRDVDGKLYEGPPWTSPSEGAANIITGMLDPTISDQSGAYIEQNAIADSVLPKQSLDENNWTRLWELSENFIQEKYSI
ncbi:hypothetical protein N7495_005718 [Penicillium taxi]|uniref:uncharacterized protein n=1 Tax=Penicillium taxi TaxID=168475 RepID=UPI0025455A76|nr:uncharacterized protein N7495_005718 [Penicillium taxi]KAJ5894027.1 hypothetical protein N7495_005718 [Penicillium taxi]